MTSSFPNNSSNAGVPSTVRKNIIPESDLSGKSDSIPEVHSSSETHTQKPVEVPEIQPAGTVFSTPSPNPVQNTAVPETKNPVNTKNTNSLQDGSVTRTVSPMYVHEKESPFVELPEVKIDGDLLELGVIFDEYELIRYIGGGGMGNVWLAQDSNLNRLVALKVLHSDKSSNVEVIQRFYSEAQVAALLNHPNISQIYSFRDHRETRRMFLTMEYIPGENLRDRVKNSGVLKVSETVSIAIQITHALEHMARHHIVHRDIKPSNILLTDSGDAKLIDLGLARIIVSPQDSADPTESIAIPSDITASGVTLGTFDYISPEQARDPRTVDTRSDIYSLGCTLYYLLTGHPPFPQGNPLQKLLQHQSDNPMDVRLSRVDVPESLNLVLTRTMKKNPDERYSTPEELLFDLERVALEIGLPVNNSLVGTFPLESEYSSFFSSIFTWRFVARHLCWILPVLIFFTAIAFLQKMWTPDATELELPPAPGIERNFPESAQETPVSEE